MTYDNRLIHTLLGLGPRRLILRLLFDSRRRIDLLVGSYSKYLLFLHLTPPPALWPFVDHLNKPERAESIPAFHTFTFLNQTRTLAYPLIWNNPLWPRLWQFNLHYFEWSLPWLNSFLHTGEWPSEASCFEDLIDNWIDSNPPPYGDGWHSYTISLRLRIWSWFFILIPPLKTSKRLSSLWLQLMWLQRHQESSNGGNHYLENLLILSSLPTLFDSSSAHDIANRALSQLQSELNSQILPDGGHEERSAGYHILLLDRLVEFACFQHLVNNTTLEWVDSCIFKMSIWLQSIRLSDGSFFPYNDSAPDVYPDLDEVLSFAFSYLQKSGSQPKSSFRRHLLLLTTSRQAYYSTELYGSLSNRINQSPSVVDLPFTGLTLVSSPSSWEFSYKCGIPSPNHLAGHTHSDQLSINLSHSGLPILCEAGTSTYEDCPQRHYERSSAAHNVLRIGTINQPNNIRWIEPVDVWGSFRAGRKASPILRQVDSVNTLSLRILGSLDVYRELGIDHIRELHLHSISSSSICLSVVDTVTTSIPIAFELYWHLAPHLSPSFLSDSAFTCPTSACSKQFIITTYSPAFNITVNRSTLLLDGLLRPGKHTVLSSLNLSNP